MDHLPKIVIRTINPDNQRYPTCGDWQYDPEENILTVSISRMGDWRSELAVAIHELFESCGCIHEEITTTQVDQFDFKFEAERDAGKHKDGDEAGDDERAPYHKWHVMATRVEREVCAQMFLPWDEHDKNVNEA